MIKSFYNFGGVSTHYRIWFYVFCHNCTPGYDCIFSDCNTRKNHCTSTNPCVLLDNYRTMENHLTMVEVMVGSHEHHVWTNLHIVIDNNTSGRHHTTIVVYEHVATMCCDRLQRLRH